MVQIGNDIFISLFEPNRVSQEFSLILMSIVISYSQTSGTNSIVVPYSSKGNPFGGKETAYSIHTQGIICVYTTQWVYVIYTVSHDLGICSLRRTSKSLLWKNYHSSPDSVTRRTAPTLTSARGDIWVLCFLADTRKILISFSHCKRICSSFACKQQLLTAWKVLV